MQWMAQRLSFAVQLAAILLLAASAAAQGVGGGIVGTVSDQTQGVLPGVTVTVTGPALMGTRSDVTAPDGSYRLPNLPPGSDYTVVFELAGFGTFKREGIRLDVGFTATINATLVPPASRRRSRSAAPLRSSTSRRRVLPRTWTRSRSRPCSSARATTRRSCRRCQAC